MPDPAEQLQRSISPDSSSRHSTGFPSAWGSARNCIALLVPSVGGLQMWALLAGVWARPIWRPDVKEGRPVFQAKQEIVDATPERLATLRRFRGRPADHPEACDRSVAVWLQARSQELEAPHTRIAKLTRCRRRSATLSLCLRSTARNSTP